MNVLLQNEFIAKVKAELKAQGISQSDLARSMGVSRSMVSAYLAGNKVPTVDMIEKFFSALGVDVHLATSPAPKRKQLQSA